MLVLKYSIKLIATFIILHALTLNVTAQTSHSSCSANRYISVVFPNVSISSDIQFGNNITIGGANTNLYMDIYEPEGDTASFRPLIILAHGGSFISGHRNELADLCAFYAKHGFVAATIDYRLYDGPLPLEDELTAGLDQIYKGVSDMKAAVRYFREDGSTSNVYKIDPDQIFVGGVSAGAIIANHTGYLDSSDSIDDLVSNIIISNGGFNGNSSNNTEFSSQVNGIINFSGAILDANLIDSMGPPIFSVHEEDDTIVPFNRGFLSFFGLNVLEADGSNVMHTRASSLSLTNQLEIINSDDHVGYLDSSSSKEEILDLSANFLNGLLCNKTLDIQILNHSTSLKLTPNPTYNSFRIYDESDRIFNLHLYHINGSKISTYPNFKTNRSTVNLNLPSGIYIIRLENENTSKTLRLVKQ